MVTTMLAVPPSDYTEKAPDGSTSTKITKDRDDPQALAKFWADWERLGEIDAFDQLGKWKIGKLGKIDG